MHFSYPALSYKQKSLLVEVMYLFILSVLVPLGIGSQIWTDYRYTLSLILVTSFNLPVIILFYRWLLPITFGKGRYVLFFLLFPLYMIAYEINVRLSSIIGMNLSFIPQGYRNNLASGHPQDFSTHFWNQTFGYTCLVLLAATSIYTIRQIYKSQHQMFTLATDKLRLELNHLKSQVQPHFFFNTLNNLYSLSVQGSSKTSAMIADLSSIMRYVLYESQHEKVSLEKEINFIKSYIELEKIRHDDAGIIDFALQGDIDNIEIEPLIFLPLIENTFKHSLAKDLPGKYVKIMLAVDEDELIFQTTNPIAKDRQELPAETGGIGLTNVKKRLELLYPGRHQLDIDQDATTFTVFLTIKFANNK